MAASVINDSLDGSANIRLSTALADWTDDSVPDHSEVDGMVMNRFASSDSKPATGVRRQSGIYRLSHDTGNGQLHGRTLCPERSDMAVS